MLHFPSPFPRVIILLHAAVALLCTPSCSTPDYPSDHKPQSRKTARQMEHYERLYGTRQLGEPGMSDTYRPRSDDDNPFTTLRN